LQDRPLEEQSREILKILKKKYPDLFEESDSNHLKNNKNKLVSNLKETGTVFSRKDFNRLDTDDFEEEA
jgi:hypothetical protein